jgi:hypothetical protein
MNPTLVAADSNGHLARGGPSLVSMLLFYGVAHVADLPDPRTREEFLTLAHGSA